MVLASSTTLWPIVTIAMTD